MTRVHLSAGSCVYDGRFANNGWLQGIAEAGDETTWDNAACSAQRLPKSTNHAPGRSAGRRARQGLFDVIDIALSNSKVTAAAWRTAGQADGVVVLARIRPQARRLHGHEQGFDAYAVRSSTGLWTPPAARSPKTGEDYPLACTQYHFNMEGRQILATGTLGNTGRIRPRSRVRRATAKRTFALQRILLRLRCGHGH